MRWMHVARLRGALFALKFGISRQASITKRPCSGTGQSAYTGLLGMGMTMGVVHGSLRGAVAKGTGTASGAGPTWHLGM